MLLAIAGGASFWCWWLEFEDEGGDRWWCWLVTGWRRWLCMVLEVRLVLEMMGGRGDDEGGGKRSSW